MNDWGLASAALKRKRLECPIVPGAQLFARTQIDHLASRITVPREDLGGEPWRPLPYPRAFSSPVFERESRSTEGADALARIPPLPAEVVALFQPAVLALQFGYPADESTRRNTLSDAVVIPGLREAEIDRLYGLLHELPDSDDPDVLRASERLTGRLRDLQRQEADAIEAHFTKNCELQPGEGYAALAMGELLISEYGD